MGEFVLQGLDVQNEYGEAASAAIPEYCKESHCPKAERIAHYAAVDAAIEEDVTPELIRQRVARTILKICPICVEHKRI